VNFTIKVVTTVHWLRHSIILEDVKTSPRKYVRNDAGHPPMQTTERYIESDFRGRHAYGKFSLKNNGLMNEFMVIKKHKELISCQDCGHLYQAPIVEENQQLECKYCDCIMLTRRVDWEHKVIALTVTGIILFFISNIFPFISIESAGNIQHSNLITGVQALIIRENFLLAALVFITIFLFPLLELVGLFYISLFRHLNLRAPFIGKIVHLLHSSRPWGMLEIFLIGVAVACVKLGSFASIELGIGFYSFVGLVFTLIANDVYLNREEIWDWLNHDNYFVNKENETVIACHCCGAHVGASLLKDTAECPRCAFHIHTDSNNSIQNTAALLFAAALLYVPSNLLPIMKTTHLGQTSSDTILSGIVHLIQSGDIPIALVVFIASIIVPIAKLLVMFYLLWNVSIKKPSNPVKLAYLFRLTEFVGRWSMIDVFVVTTLVALVQFGLLATIEPGGALLCFAGVVVLTMFAAETFDPKLIWTQDENTKN